MTRWRLTRRHVVLHATTAWFRQFHVDFLRGRKSAQALQMSPFLFEHNRNVVVTVPFYHDTLICWFEDDALRNLKELPVGAGRVSEKCFLFPGCGLNAAAIRQEVIFMHNSGGGIVISAARGPNEQYKTVFRIKKRFVITAVMRFPASLPLFLKHLHNFSPSVLLASNPLQIITNIKPSRAHCKAWSISVISYHLIWFESPATFQMWCQYCWWR